MCAFVSVGDFIREKLCIVLILGHSYICRICAKAIKTRKQDRLCVSFLGPLTKNTHKLIKISVIIFYNNTRKCIILNQLLFNIFVILLLYLF